jgi:hypothetical protein
VRTVEGRPADSRLPPPRPTAGRSSSRPLVARTEVLDERRPRTQVRGRPGRVRRFVHRYGWRAYAVPLLTIATLVALIDVALTTPSDAGTTATQAPVPSPEALATPPEPQPTAPAELDAGPSEVPVVTGAETYVEKGAGTVSVVDGSSPVLGTGPLHRFVVEVEDGIGVAGAAFAEAVETTLGDPRSWGNGGKMSFQRVGAAESAAGQYEFKVTLVSPGNMETYCPGVGTGGYTSCRYGDRAVINLARWATAVPHYDGDIATYRLYVVNHEVGHALGNGHRDCPGAGQLAPVMQQQTLGLHGCVKNAWPYP